MSKGAMLCYAVALLLAVLLVGCGASATDFPTGVFTARGGTWVLTLDDDGNSTFSEDGTVEAIGTFSIQEDEVTWETDSYCDPRGAGPATYTWAFEDAILLFHVKGEDKCSGRLGALDSVPYKEEE